MHINWDLFFSALGLALVLEGIPYFLWAERMPSVLRLLASKSPASLRKMGLTSILFGLLLIYFCKT